MTTWNGGYRAGDDPLSEMRARVWKDLGILAGLDFAGGRVDRFEYELGEIDVMILDAGLLEVARIKRCLGPIRETLEAALLADVQANGAIRLGDEGFYSGKAGGKKLIDPDSLLLWLFAEGDPYLNVKGAVRLDDGNVRITALDSIAEERGVEKPEAIRDTFYEYPDTDERELKRVPASKAKWVEALEPGQRRQPPTSRSGK